MGWLTDALPAIVKNGAPWLLVFLLVWLFVTWLRNQYDQRVADLKSHNAEVVAILSKQIDTGGINADSLAKVLTVAETTQRLVEALPRVGTPT